MECEYDGKRIYGYVRSVVLRKDEIKLNACRQVWVIDRICSAACKGHTEPQDQAKQHFQVDQVDSGTCKRHGECGGYCKKCF